MFRLRSVANTNDLECLSHSYIAMHQRRGIAKELGKTIRHYDEAIFADRVREGAIVDRRRI